MSLDSPMKSFQDFVVEQDRIGEGLREFLLNTINRLSHLEPKDVEDAKDMLLDLQKLLEDKLTGV